MTLWRVSSISGPSAGLLPSSASPSAHNASPRHPEIGHDLEGLLRIRKVFATVNSGRIDGQ
jgi:hypothetical protein